MIDPAFRFVTANGIRFRVAELGEGPLVLLLHGWPESWYSWRHQMRALAESGYRAAAPDMRGYGDTDKPEAVETYDMHHLMADVTGLVEALGEERCHLVGHDWGAIVAWPTAVCFPERFRSLITMSVPYIGRSPASLTELLKLQYGDEFNYILYHQEPGIAEAEYDADVRGLLKRLYVSPDTPTQFDRQLLTASVKLTDVRTHFQFKPAVAPNATTRRRRNTFGDEQDAEVGIERVIIADKVVRLFDVAFCLGC